MLLMIIFKPKLSFKLKLDPKTCTFKILEKILEKVWQLVSKFKLNCRFSFLTELTIKIVGYSESKLTSTLSHPNTGGNCFILFF